MHLFQINFKFCSLLVTKLSYTTWSCIKEAFTIFLRRPSTFHLEGKFRKTSYLKFLTLHHQVQYGWRWIRINPLNPTAHIWLLNHGLHGYWILCKTSYHSGHIRLRILISFNWSTKFNLIHKELKPRLEVKVEGPEDDKKVKEVNHKG